MNVFAWLVFFFGVAYAVSHLADSTPPLRASGGVVEHLTECTTCLIPANRGLDGALHD
jgi:hypothetical protein